MEQWESPMGGVTRISNPKTLKRWINLGWYKKLIDVGYVFNPYCGRYVNVVNAGIKYQIEMN